MILLAAIHSLAFAAALTASSCHTIAADRIYGRDLSAAVPALQALPADKQMGLAPFPGQQRVFRAGELKKIAAANGITADFTDGVCFAWQMSVPTPDAIRAAMQKTLANRNATIELVDQSLAPAPPGEMNFVLSGLSGTSDGPVLWRGSIAYADKRIFTIWARVRVTVREPHVIAAQVLKPGEEVRKEQIRLENYEGPLPRDPHYVAVSEVVGLTARNNIAAGLPLTKVLLRERSEVERGDLVQVIVQAERTHLEAQGVAEESGQRGSMITVRNARSGRKFRARVEDKDRVLVVPAGPTGLVTEESKHESSN